MILQNRVWYDIIPSFNWGEVSMPITGKWLYFGDRTFIHSLLPILDDLVEKGEIRSVKISRKIPEYDPFPEKKCVMCVFTSERQEEKEGIKLLLKNKFGIEVNIWKSEEQTLKDWEEGGWLRLESNINKLRRKIQSGEIQNKEAAYHRIVSLIEQLGKTLSEIDDPDHKTEFYLDRIHESKREIEMGLEKDQLQYQECISLFHR